MYKRQDNIKDDEELVNNLGEWVATRVVCSLRGGGETWLLRSVLRANQEPAVELIRGDTPLDVVVAAEAFVQDQHTAGTVGESAFAVIGNYLPGIEVADAGVVKMAASLQPNNNTLWLSNGNNASDDLAFFSAAYVLMLQSWLSGSG